MGFRANARPPWPYQAHRCLVGMEGKLWRMSASLSACVGKVPRRWCAQWGGVNKNSVSLSLSLSLCLSVSLSLCLSVSLSLCLSLFL